MLFAMDDPGSCNTRKLYVELPDGDIAYSQISPNCIANVEFFGPFKSHTWIMPAGGEDFDTDDMRFESGSGNHSGFRFNEPGEYRIWAEYRSNGMDFKDDSKPRSIDRTVISNMIRVAVE